MFASFKSDDQGRGTQVLVSDLPLGPFSPLANKPTTPEGWDCLDGTFYIDDDNTPWMIFCHEFTQTTDGQICAIKLTSELNAAASEPILLFTASQAPSRTRRDISISAS